MFIECVHTFMGRAIYICQSNGTAVLSIVHVIVAGLSVEEYNMLCDFRDWVFLCGF